MSYRVVATLGPASGGKKMWRGLLEAGATAFRLNTAHFQLEALQRGFRGFVLSDETAVGAYPLEACRSAALFRSR